MDAVVQLNTALVGRYAIDREIGRGGMATVYLARDLRHDRNVALKVLTPELGAVLGAERFLAEIKVTATLQHPNLLPLFDSGEADGFFFYVMPFVEGESLRARMEREGQFPIDEVLRVVTAVAGALEYAHQQGVIHRDLKPENILLQSGQPVIADFGIALAVSNAGGSRLTQTGLSLGTPQYMSPEQATGDRHLDRRADIYSLGAITYEMLTGEPPHVGPTAQAIIARLLTEAPRSLRISRPNVPEHVDAAVMRALEILPADRFASAAAFAEALHRPALMRAPRSKSHLSGVVSAITGWRVWAATAAIAVAWGVVAWRRSTTADPQQRVVQVVLDLPLANPVLTIDPAGRRIVYVGRPAGDSSAPQRLYVRNLDRLTSAEIPGTTGADSPVLSPDGEVVIFRVGRSIRRIGVTGAGAATLADSVDALPAGINEAGAVLLNGPSELLEIESDGGAAKVIYAAPGHEVHSAIQLRGTSTFLFVDCPHPGWCTEEERELFAVTRGAHAPQLVPGFHGIHRVRHTGNALIYQTADRRLHVVRFDARTLTALGEPSIVGEQTSYYVLSERGDLVSVWDPPPELEFVTWEPTGATHTLGGPHRFYASPVVSPDGRSIAAEVEGIGRLVLLDIEQHTLRELTSTGHIGGVDWSIDGKRLVYSIYRNGVMRLEWLALDGDLQPHAFGKGTPIKGLGGSGFLVPSWVPDGRHVIYQVGNDSGRHDIVMTTLDSAPVEIPVIRSHWNMTQPRVSPDGRWLAYVSNESGQAQLYVERFPVDTARDRARTIVSVDGIRGVFQWGSGVPTLNYRAPDGWIYAAHLDLGGTPRVTSRDRVVDARGYSAWSPFPDGRRMLFVRPAAAVDRQRVTLTLDWYRSLRQK